MNEAKRAIQSAMIVLFGKTKKVVENASQDAAEAAVLAGVKEDKEILKALFPDAKDRNDYIDAQKASARRNVQNAISHLLKDKVPLSRRVYRSQAIATGLLERTVQSGLARGASVAELSQDIRASIRPDSPGGVSYSAKRLARTEINNAFHGTSIADNVDKPWVDSMEWHLSKSHRASGCVCERYAARKIFDKSGVPAKPHPNCFCYLTPHVIPFNEFKANLLMGNYDEWVGDNVAA